MTDKEKLDDLAEWETNETPEKDDSHKAEDNDAKIARYKEQMKWDKADALKYRQMALDAEVAKAKKDGNSLTDLHNKDPKLASEVAKEFWFDSYDEAINAYKEQTKWDSSEVSMKENTAWDDYISKKDLDKIIEERENKKLHEVATKKAEKIIGKITDDDLREKAQANFDKITKGRILTLDEAEEFAEMATLYVSKDKIKGEKYDEWLASLWSIGLSSSKKWSKSKDDDYVVVWGKLVLNPNKQN